MSDMPHITEDDYRRISDKVCAGTEDGHYMVPLDCGLDMEIWTSIYLSTYCPDEYQYNGDQIIEGVSVTVSNEYIVPEEEEDPCPDDTDDDFDKYRVENELIDYILCLGMV